MRQIDRQTTDKQRERRVVYMRCIPAFGGILQDLVSATGEP